MNVFKVSNPEGWTKEQFDDFLSKYFQDEDNFDDTWDGDSCFDGNIFSDDDSGLAMCNIYTFGHSSYIDELIAWCNLEIEQK